MKQVNLDNGKSIKVYDNLFDLKYKQFLFNFIYTSKYTIGWADTDIPEKQQYKNLHSQYNDEDLINCGIIKELDRVGILKEVEGLQLNRCNINLSTPSDSHFIHSHPEKKVILYYPNLEWYDGWHGETMFFEENSRDVVFTSSYTPGRIVVFDGDIPHSIRPQSTIAAKFRFTLALMYV